MTAHLTPAQRNALSHAVREAYLEVFPAGSVEKRLSVLPAKSCVAVTCSPTRGVDVTLDICERLVRRGFRVVPHVVAKTVRDEPHLREILRRIGNLHIDSIFVPGGDGPKPIGKYSTAYELLRAIAEHDHGIREIGVAGHPEGHPSVPKHVLMDELERKQALATYLVTQMCFDAPALSTWLRAVRDRGIGLPAWIGLPGVVDRAVLLATSMRIGVGDSLRFLRSQGNVVGRLLTSYRPDDFLRELAPTLADPLLRVAGFHLYSFNQVKQSEDWRKAYLATLGEE